jgi:hypothetical protein
MNHQLEEITKIAQNKPPTNNQTKIKIPSINPQSNPAQKKIPSTKPQYQQQKIQPINPQLLHLQIPLMKLQSITQPKQKLQIPTINYQ